MRGVRCGFARRREGFGVVYQAAASFSEPVAIAWMVSVKNRRSCAWTRAQRESAESPVSTELHVSGEHNAVDRVFMEATQDGSVAGRGWMREDTLASLCARAVSRRQKAATLPTAGFTASQGVLSKSNTPGRKNRRRGSGPDNQRYSDTHRCSCDRSSPRIPRSCQRSSPRTQTRHNRLRTCIGLASTGMAAGSDTHDPTPRNKTPGTTLAMKV